jgi:phosphatidylglycerophosphate synthase
VGLLCVVALLAALTATADLGPSGAVAGALAGVSGCLLLARALAGHGRVALSPADRLTLARLVLGCGIAALTVTAIARDEPAAPVLVPLAGVALLLDWLDGRVARITGTVSELGARFDMETDAFLILVLSGYVAATTGWWVLAIGLARYAFVAAGRVWPWLQESAPPRYWCKVVAAAQGIVLTVAAADLLPAMVEAAVVAVALGLLAESFGRQVGQLWQLEQQRQQRLVSVASGGATADTRAVIVAGSADGSAREHVPAARVATGLGDA